MSRSFIKLVIIAIFFISAISCGSSSDLTSEGPKSYIAPGYIKKDYQKILVLAHVDPDIFRRRIERNVIAEFKDRKYKVEGSLEFFKPEMLADSLALRDEVIKRGYDGALVLTYLGEMTGVRDEYNYNGNVYTVFGGGFPVFDLDTRSTKTYYFQADFFTLTGKGTQWRAGFSARGGQDADNALRDMASKIRRKMQIDKIL